jgi:hypothetical protein
MASVRGEPFTPGGKVFNQPGFDDVPKRFALIDKHLVD